jgi:hypothetical protein
MYFPDIPKLADWKTFTLRGPLVAVPKGGAPPITPEMKQIDDLIQRYYQVMPMARINTLNELKPIVDSLLAKTPKPVVKLTQLDNPAAKIYEALQALKEAVARKLKTVIPANALYDQVVCLGYSIETGTVRDYLDPSGTVWKSTGGGYMGYKNPKTDLAARCNQMIAAIKVAYTLNQQKMVITNKVVSDARTLKIFVAPEFFFRGQRGAFTMDYLMGNKGEQSILDKLRAETGQGKYASWLFVLGTFIAGTERTESACQTCHQWMQPELVASAGKKLLTCPTCKKQLICDVPTCKGALIVPQAMTQSPSVRWFICSKCKKKSNFTEHCVGVAIDNYALVQKGGYSAGDGVHDYCTQKQLVSNLDFDEVDNQAPKIKIFRRQEEFIQPVSDPGSANERMGGGIFNMDGITYGLEVCLDHLEGRLAAAPDKGRIQIQLVPSAGAYIEPGSVACVTDGIVFNVDGGAGAEVSVAVNASTGLTTKTSKGELPVGNVSQGCFPPSNQKVMVFGPFGMPPA